MHAAVLLLSFDMEKAERCFDSFQTVIERKGGGWVKERERWGEVGVAEKESWTAQCHTREDCREENREGMGEVRRTGLSVCL